MTKNSSEFPHISNVTVEPATDNSEAAPHPVPDALSALTRDQIGAIAVEHDPEPSPTPELGPEIYLP